MADRTDSSRGEIDIKLHEGVYAGVLGLEVAGFSCLTNLAAGLSKEKLSHDEVLAIGKSSAKNFSKLLNAACGKVA